jgi:hypothetical protein
MTVLGRRCKTADNALINRRIMEASRGHGIHELMRVVEQYLPSMNLVNLSTSLHRLAKAVSADPDQLVLLKRRQLLAPLLEQTQQAFKATTTAQPQSLSNVGWALAILQPESRTLHEVIASASVGELHRFKPFELTMLLWAMAKSGASGSGCPLFHSAARHIVAASRRFDFRCLAMTIWSFATVRITDVHLLRSVATRMTSLAHEASCQELGNAVWAFGTLGQKCDELSNALAERGLELYDEFPLNRPQELSNMIWGFAANGYFHEAFFTAAAELALRADLSTQHLANILSSYAKLQPCHPVTFKLMCSLTPLCTKNVCAFKQMEIASTANAVATVLTMDGSCIPEPNVMMFFQKVAVHWGHSLQMFSDASLVNLFGAYVRINDCHPAFWEMLTAIQHELSSRIYGANNAGLLTLLNLLEDLRVRSQFAHDAAGYIALQLADCVPRLPAREKKNLSIFLCSILSLPKQRLNNRQLEEYCVNLANAGAEHVSISSSSTKVDSQSVVESESVATDAQTLYSPTTAHEFVSEECFTGTWTCSVKNSFVHVEACRNDDDAPKRIGFERFKSAPPSALHVMSSSMDEMAQTESDGLDDVSEDAPDSPTIIPSTTPRWGLPAECAEETFTVKNSFWHIETHDSSDEDGSQTLGPFPKRLDFERYKSAPAAAYLTTLLLGC